jgi:hypothetical protein
MISAYYYITYTTIELFSSSLTAKTKLKVRARRGNFLPLEAVVCFVVGLAGDSARLSFFW